jgi:hypothetical protein
MTDTATIHRADKSQRTYKRVCLDFTDDARLSPEAIGVMAYLLARSDDWKIVPQQLKERFKIGRDKVYRILGELKAAGYLTQERTHDEQGRLVWGDYHLHEVSPLPGLPYTENKEMASPFPDLPYTENKDRIPNVDHTQEPTPNGVAPAAKIAPAPEDAPRPDRPARTPSTPRGARPPSPPLATATPTPAVAGQVPAEIEQPRLVDAEMPDPVKVYQEVCKVKRPNEVQRTKIRELVTTYPDEWRGVCERWMLNGWYTGKVENMLDAYQKQVAERRKADARRAEAERSRAAMAAPPDDQPVSRERARELFAQFRAWKEPATAPSATA